ncbi:MAG: hypothetical protein JWM37_113 [Candidatus Saccharibacteria bacterium]|nr:hypothetical protein [Candidatus Saccharibacteria bacterium]
MLNNRFVITHLDFEADHGLARQIAPINSDTLGQQFGFTISGAVQVFFDFEEDHGYGYRIPDQVIKDRMPEIGEELVGAIAADDGGTAHDAHGNPFLRNWAYAEQYDALKATVDSTDTQSDDSSPEDDDDLVSTTTVYARALTHFRGNHELAREASEMYPGDFI